MIEPSMKLVQHLHPELAPRAAAPSWLEFPGYLLEHAGDEPLDDEVVSRFHDEFQNSQGHAQ